MITLHTQDVISIVTGAQLGPPAREWLAIQQIHDLVIPRYEVGWRRREASAHLLRVLPEFSGLEPDWSSAVALRKWESELSAKYANYVSIETIPEAKASHDRQCAFIRALKVSAIHALPKPWPSYLPERPTIDSLRGWPEFSRASLIGVDPCPRSYSFSLNGVMCNPDPIKPAATFDAPVATKTAAPGDRRKTVRRAR